MGSALRERSGLDACLANSPYPVKRKAANTPRTAVARSSAGLKNHQDHDADEQYSRHLVEPAEGPLARRAAIGRELPDQRAMTPWLRRAARPGGLGVQPAGRPLPWRVARATPNAMVAIIAGVVMPRSSRRSMILYFSDASLPAATWLW